MFGPLHHLLARNEDAMALSELLLQAIKGKVIVIASQYHVHGQSRPEPTLWHQPRRKSRNGHSSFAAAAGVFGTHNPASDEFRRDEVDLFRNFFPIRSGILPQQRQGTSSGSIVMVSVSICAGRG